MIDLKSHKELFESHIARYREEISRFRTGRAHSSLVDNILVDAYGTMTQIAHLGTISIPDARSLLITPWDASVLKEIEKAIATANIGAQTTNDGASIRVLLPTLTEENRRNLTKLLKERSEKARIAIRGVRDEVRDSIMTAQRNKEITEDDKFQMLKKLDEMTKEYIEEVEGAASKKEQEIMTI
ncbi:ribosome recycling factor [Candidatus Uhrbacteria bacterium]|nr:ribosome recycling factor [Candidatus Uhrbacteria bacterium]